MHTVLNDARRNALNDVDCMIQLIFFADLNLCNYDCDVIMGD